MGTLRRKDLKPARKISDARFLAGAQASATKAQTRLERSRRAEQTSAELAAQDRGKLPARGTPSDG
jgi:hypothetical protein